MSPKLPRITAAELLRALARDGWFVDRQRGSHVVLKHPSKNGWAVVPNHPVKTLRAKTLQTILDEAGIDPNRLRELL